MEKGKTLHLVLTYYWYDKIASGRKRVEFREVKPHYQRMIDGKNITHVRLQRGFTKQPPTMLYEVERIVIRKIKGIPHYCIALGCEVLWMPAKEVTNG